MFALSVPGLFPGPPRNKRSSLHPPVRPNILRYLKPPKNAFGYILYLILLGTAKLLLLQFPVTTPQPRPFLKTLFCIPVSSILTSNIISFVSTYNLLTYTLTTLTLNTMSPTCSQRPWMLSNSLTFDISWALSDRFHARSYHGGKETSAHFLTPPILSHLLSVHRYSPSSPRYSLQGPDL
jgi:hypothetical protein